ncbi:spt2 chromatin protein [Colletotrichum truncatum]|uniref:Spt2 chromatin protein n=1 Tax=Colletotrichum truncatum TaxID=5467 RepID=A0ACC3YZL3_COLTU|nr:spt2 chromatin protein [Colletotrichum truncatum]KAF6792576.1 spt2 chromatin protein [Colletotrichum truncatum]
MPIGDLLAQISGDKSQSTSPAPSRPPVAAAAKRKADDDLRSAISNKTPRTSTALPSSSSASKPAGVPKSATRVVDKPTTTTTGYRGSAARPLDRTSSTSRPQGNSNITSKPSSSSSRPPNGSITSRVSSTLPSRPSPSTPAPAKDGPAPKKGSFAEILARAKKAQESMGQVGKIQHKPVEKVLTKKEREEMAKEAKRDAKIATAKGAAARQPSKFQGTARPSSGAPQRNGSGTSGAARNGTVDRARDPRAAAKARAAEEEQEKKLKKAAVATTGYTGTARPRPGATSNKKKPAPGGALLNARPAPRYGGSAKRSRYEEEEDEDLDDFIEYDDDEDEGGPRYTYDSDGSSDMEAGMDDVWEEEIKAERVARREDLEEERLEKRLKAEKEERKRRFWEQQQRGGRR